MPEVLTGSHRVVGQPDDTVPEADGTNQGPSVFGSEAEVQELMQKLEKMQMSAPQHYKCQTTKIALVKSACCPRRRAIRR
eukprot:SAG11_NODE_283_length_11241_cov_8.234428_12_plen_80_part_00